MPEFYPNRSLSGLRVNHAQPEVFLKRIEITVAVQKAMPFLQAKSCNQAINGFAYRVTATPQNTVVLRRRDGQLSPAGVEYVESGKTLPDLRESGVAPNSLQHFAEDEIGQPQTLSFYFPIQPGSL